jgi:acetyltransferase-like isoleucine patch superfamily enzyme
MAEKSEIKKLNTIKEICSFLMDEYVIICSTNWFIGAYRDIFPYKKYSNFSIGERSLITASHYFDITDSVTIGKNVVFGGRYSSIWTHGFDVQHVMIQSPIHIGSDIYIGSNVIICQGVSIVENSVIGAGTVVSKDITAPGFYISSQLIRKSDSRSYSEENATITFNGAKFYREKK